MKRFNKKAEIVICLFLTVVVIWGMRGGHTVREVSSQGVRVVIDPGHGIPDGGAVGESGVPESEINLKVSKYIQKKLESAGIKTIMTRLDENALYEDENASVRNKKRDDMRKRKEVMLHILK